ncbi:Hypothetical Protein OBI_RACECAR_190 [Arthrobacter phage Racecar]|nr:hypothetical protein PBI_RACECAR_272 [Arthrobacter phage Racecar]
MLKSFHRARQTLEKGTFSMKKFFASLMSLALLLLASVLFAVPAEASESKQATICHFDAGQGGKYTQNTVSKNSIVKKNGEEGGHGSHDQDIIPPFTWDDGGNDHGSYPGQKWTPENQALWANGCNPANNVLTPALARPTVQATCLDPIGQSDLLLPAQPANVTAADPVLNGDKTLWTIVFSKTANTLYQTYEWAQGVSESQTIKILPPLTTDPLWDTEAGECRMPDTGAGGISNTALMFGGVAIGLGMVFLGVTSIMKRRESK